MAIAIIMPKQGQSVESCIITEIYKKKGDSVKKGDIIFTYETDKASFEEESPVDGVVLECFYGEGDEVPVLDNMMVIGEPGEDYSDLTGEQEVEEGKSDDSISNASDENIEVVNNTSKVETKIIAKTDQPKFISPRAKKLAEKESVEISNIEGSGPKGRVIEKDVKQFLTDRPRMTPLAKKIASEGGLQPQEYGTGLAGAARATDLAASDNNLFGVDYEDRKLSNMRKIIAKSMHASLQNSAQLTHHLSADARRLLELRKNIKTALEEKAIEANITLNDMVCFAVIKALNKFPEVNTHFLGESKRYFNKVHLGLAVDTERGLMVPVIKNADDLSLTGLSNRLKAVAESCRKGNVNPDILAPEAGTFTVSNLGNYGVEMFTPVINLPQSAILGVNTILPRPKDLGDGVYAFVPHIGLSLTYDHRSLDGGEATRFLRQIAIEIENLQLDITL
ncbi:MAG TPA: 2-oxo acid dehydrogenase subunit E2 [Bacteroidales bacterium]|nr:2-oxo acid dehydrogenase subunit E2 [Bacteroidales bacterium]